MGDLLKIPLVNVFKERKFLSFDKRQTNIFIAHNGFGKSETINKMIQSSPKSYILSKVSSNNLEYKENQSFFTNDSMMSMNFTFTQIDHAFNLYTKQNMWMINDNESKYLTSALKLFKESVGIYHTGDKSWRRSFTTVDPSVTKSLEFNLGKLKSPKIDEYILDCIKSIFDSLTEAVDTGTVSFDPEYNIDFDDIDYYGVRLTMDMERDVAPDNQADVFEFMNEKESEINFELDKIKSHDGGLFDVLSDSRYFQTALSNTLIYNANFLKGTPDLHYLFVPLVFHIKEFFASLEKNSIKVSASEFSAIEKAIMNTPLRKNVFSTYKKHLILNTANRYSAGELKWINNLIFILKNRNSKETLIFDDPIDSMDLFYASSFYKFLISKRRNNTIIFTHRTELPRFAVEIDPKNTKLFNIFFNQIDPKLFRIISSKNIVDLLLTTKAHICIPILLYLRFIFKGIDNTKYSLLSEAVKDPSTKTIKELAPVIWDIAGRDVWSKKFARFSNVSIKDFCDSSTNDESLILNKIIWKKTDSYLTSLRHLSETEPLGLYLIESSLFKPN